MPDSDLTPTTIFLASSVSRPAAPEADPPTIPRSEPPTIPHSLAPLSGSNVDGTEAEEEESRSAWSELWRRRWLVGVAAVVAFLSALAIGRLNAARNGDVPPTVSGASQPAKLDVPIAADLDRGPVARATEPQGPPPSEAPARDTPVETTAPVATSETLEIPAMEVPPPKSGTSHATPRVRRATTPSDSTPRKRFTPNAI